MSTPAFQPRPLDGIVARRIHTPRMILDDVLIEFRGTDIGVMGNFAAPAPPGYYDARDAGLVVVPGLVNVHVHGGGGADFLDHTEESIQRISTMGAAGGATSMVATTTIPVDDASLEGFGEFLRLLRAARPRGARFVGLHLEGPFLNPEKRGGFGPRYVQPVDLRQAERILEMCGDILLKITVAPEIDRGDDLIRLILDNPNTQIEVSLGHTTADFGLARRFFGMERVRQVTHAFNAMSAYHHREPGLIGAALLDDNVWMEMIPDGHHLSGPTIALLHRTKGPGRLMMITDGSGATGLPEGSRVTSVGGATVVEDDAVRLASDGTLAGSNILMAGALARTRTLGGVPMEDALEMATLTPARSIHREALIGSIEPGKRADLCVLRDDGSVAATIRDGTLVYEAG